MDAHLKLLADAALQVSAAEEALAAEDPGRAREALAQAEDGLAELRSRWPSMTPTARAVIGRAAGPVRSRLDAARALLPRRVPPGDARPQRDAGGDAGPVAAA
jgi:hypothetical protein